MRKTKTKSICPICNSPNCPLTESYLRQSDAKEKKHAKKHAKKKNENPNLPDANQMPDVQSH